MSYQPEFLQHQILYIVSEYLELINKLASLEATLVRNYDLLTHWLADGGEV